MNFRLMTVVFWVASTACTTLEFEANSHLTFSAEPYNFSSPESASRVLVDISKRGDESFDARLDSLYENLMAFIRFTDFMVEEFDWATEKLNKKVTELVSEIKASSPDLDILSKTFYVETVFNDMIETLLKLNYYTHEDNKAMTLLNNVIELKVSLYAMYNSRGIPRFSGPGYVFRVRRYVEILDFLQDEFSLVADVTFALNLLFEKYHTAARNSIVILESYISATS